MPLSPKNQRRIFAVVSVSAAIFLALAWYLGATAPRPASAPAAVTALPVAPAHASAAPQTPVSVRVPILVYHNIRPAPPHPLSAADEQYEVTPAQFEAELSYLKDAGYAAVGFDDLLAAQRGDKPLPDRAVIITLDDGHETQYQYALPLLEKYGLRATFFIFSNAIGRPEYMTWDQLKDLRARGMTIAGHTRFHPFLTKITDDADLRAEIIGSKKTIEDGVGAPVLYFAYPFGLYDDRVVAMVKEAGYLAARGLKHHALQPPDEDFALGGFIATGDLSYFKSILASPR